MAVIHKGKYDLRRSLRSATLLACLCLPLAVLTAALTVLLYIDCGERLQQLASGWQDSFCAYTVTPGDAAVFEESWHGTLWAVLRGLLQAIGWLIFGGTVALPGVTGLTIAVLLARLFVPAIRRCRELRATARGMTDALKLLRPMPKSSHLFLNKRIVFENETSQPDMILVGTGGVIVLEVRNCPGLIEGSVSDTTLRVRTPDGEVEKLRNPARQAAANATHLNGYLSSQGVNVWVTPCVLFVHENASAYVSVPEALFADGRRTRIASCIVTDAESFWAQIGRGFANGQLMPQDAAEQIAGLIQRAAHRKKRRGAVSGKFIR